MSKHKPYHPPQWDDADAIAIQALANGNANEGQQKRALDWIINQCCRTYDQSYHPDNPTDTVFAEGKRYVGNHIILMMKIKTGKVAGGKP